MTRAFAGQTILASHIHDNINRYGVDAVGTDAYAITPDPVIESYVTGQHFTFKAGTANTGACTLNVNAKGAKAIKRNVTEDLVTGDILVNQIVEVVYDAVADVFQMVSGLPVKNSDYQVFTGNGTWTKPAGLTGYEEVVVELWGGGGGGGTSDDSDNNPGAGGGGGAYNRKMFLASALGATETVTVGGGGPSDTVGGNSSFGSLLFAYGGGGGTESGNAGGGGGGGQLGAGTTAGNSSNQDRTAGSPGFPTVGDSVAQTENGATDLNVLWMQNGTWGGGAGGIKFIAARNAGGNSLYGGGGGGLGASGTGAAGGGSVHGGNGGAGGNTNAVGNAGSIPAGGGGGGGYGSGVDRAGGAGARGEVRVWVFRR